MKLRSVWVFHLNTGACNGCDIEILDVLTPYYDVERLGVKLVSTPRHAHALLVTGPLTRQSYYAAKRAYEAMPPKPRIVVAIGTCACSGGIFYDSYAIRRESERLTLEYPRAGGTSEFLPVDMYIPGCPPRPEEILYGLALLLGLAEKKLSPRHYVDEEFVLPRTQFKAWVEVILKAKIRKELGYFDGYKLLERFMGLVDIAETPETLHRLVEEEKLKEKDSRIRCGLDRLYSYYLEVVKTYEDILSQKRRVLRVQK